MIALATIIIEDIISSALKKGASVSGVHLFIFQHVDYTSRTLQWMIALNVLQISRTLYEDFIVLVEQHIHPFTEYFKG